MILNNLRQVKKLNLTNTSEITMNRKLYQQLVQIYGSLDKVPDELQPFVKAVNTTYDQLEYENTLLTQSMDASFQELYKKNKQLDKESEQRNKVVDKLKRSLNALLSVNREEAPLIGLDEQDLDEVIEMVEDESQKVRQLEEQLLIIRKLMDQSTDSIQVADESGNFVFVNKEASRRMSYTIEKLLTMKVQDIELVFKDPGSWEAHIEELKSHDNVFKEGVNVRKDGSTFPVEVNAKYVKLGGRGYVIAVSRDISSRKKSEIRQQQLMDDLAWANKELTDFAYIVSHELKAPLRGIGTLADWLVEDYSAHLDDEGKEHLRLLQQRVVRLHNLIEGVLTYSRIGRKKKNISTFAVGSVIEEVKDILDLSPTVSEIIIDAPLPTIQNDRQRITQIFQNLISNAVKYKDKACVKININCLDKGDKYLFCVKDNGPGIEMRYHQKIFQIFQTLQGAENYESTGVGLTIVKKILESQKGDIWLESKMGEGTSFFFSIYKNIMHDE